MTKRLFLLVLSIVLTSLVSCAYDDDSTPEDCTKTITIPQIYFINGQSYNYDITQEVPCDLPDPVDPIVISPPELANFTYEILSFVFTPDTGNNTLRIQYEIQLNNPNNFVATGVPILTIISDGLEFTGSFSNLASVPCFEIAANSNCILTVDIEDSLDLGGIESYEIIDVNYYLTN